MFPGKTAVMGCEVIKSLHGLAFIIINLKRIHLNNVHMCITGLIRKSKPEEAKWLPGDDVNSF